MKFLFNCFSEVTCNGTVTQNAQRTQASRLVSSQDEPRIGGDTPIASQLQGDNAAQICENISAIEAQTRPCSKNENAYHDLHKTCSEPRPYYELIRRRRAGAQRLACAGQTACTEARSRTAKTRLPQKPTRGCVT